LQGCGSKANDGITTVYSNGVWFDNQGTQHVLRGIRMSEEVQYYQLGRGNRICKGMIV
jgi:hypothetical protein